MRFSFLPNSFTSFTAFCAISVSLSTGLFTTAFALDEVQLEGVKPTEVKKTTSPVFETLKPKTNLPVSAASSSQPTAEPTNDQVSAVSPSGATPAAPATGETGEAKKGFTARAVLVDIDSETLNYDDKVNGYVAKGNVHVVVSEQNTELICDQLTYDQQKQILVAEGHVIIIRDGQKTNGTFARIDLNRQSALINDPFTAVQAIRLRAKHALVHEDVLTLEKGQVVMDTGKLLANTAYAQRNDPNNATLSRKTLREKYEKNNSAKMENTDDISTAAIAGTANFKANKQAAQSSTKHQGDQSMTTQNLDLSDEEWTSPLNDEGKPSAFRLKVKNVDIRRGDDDVDDIDLKNPSLYWHNLKVASLPQSNMAYMEDTGELEYLGPDIGYDADLGGFYAGPGYDFRAGRNFFRFSPLLTMGPGVQRRRNGADFENKGTGPGIGAALHFRNKRTIIDAAYSTHSNLPTLYGEYRIWRDNTKFQVSVFDDYTNGFLGYERPSAIAQLTDYREIFETKYAKLNTFASLGVARDEFYPTNSANFFVSPSSNSPQTAGRAQFQMQLRNTKPLLSMFNDHLNFGYLAQAGGAAYTTGDFTGIVRVAPTVNVNIMDRLSTSARFFLTANAGDTPFVFDSYYRGRQNLVVSNAFRVNNFLSLGLRNDWNLEGTTSGGDKLVGNQVFAMFGPKEVKFNIVYDTVRKRSYFGINFFPQGGKAKIDFDRLDMYAPQPFHASNVPGGK